MRYAIVIEKASSNYSAYCPDLPGCVATGETIEEVKKEMTEAMPKAQRLKQFYLTVKIQY